MFIEIIGWVGTAFVVLAYSLNTTGRIKASDKSYLLLNLFGSIGIIINSFSHGAIPSVGLNAVWLGIAIYGLYKAAKSRK